MLAYELRDEAGHLFMAGAMEPTPACGKVCSPWLQWPWEVLFLHGQRLGSQVTDQVESSPGTQCLWLLSAPLPSPRHIQLRCPQVTRAAEACVSRKGS